MKVGRMTALALLLLIVLGAWALVLYIKRRTREISRTLWGTDTLAEGVAQMKKEYASTPKSVSAMTSLLLPRITGDFPDFEYHEMRERAENLLVSYLRALSEQNAALITDGTTELKDQAGNEISMLQAQGKKEFFRDIKIHRTEISQYKKSAGRCMITFQSALECIHYVEDSEGRVTEGSREYKYQTRYNVDLVYIQDRNLVEDERDLALGVNCPNCGAPLSSLGAKVCAYCGTPLIEINIHAWSFVSVSEIK
ncbi:MAG: zinc ribbon domain-containing protein [Roseburia sp.]|nr:zinc ribbon domain-containing protein [Roseburia sp.]